MNWITQTLTSTIGRKFIAGLTGLGLVGFAVAHMVGNLNILVGQGNMQAYAEKLHHIPGFPLIELGLLACFVIHIGVVLSLVLENRKARGATRYAVTASKRTHRMEALASKTMAFSGITLLAFLVLHILHFRIPRAEIAGEHCGIGHEVIEVLENPFIGALYVAGSLLVAWHIFHGFGSAARSLGVNHRKYTPLLQTLGLVSAIAVGVGFSSLAILVSTGVVGESGLSFLDGMEKQCLPGGEVHGEEGEEHAEAEAEATH